VIFFSSISLTVIIFIAWPLLPELA
jgi:hypothetical protein